MTEKSAKARKAKVAPTGLVTRAVDLTRREGLGYSARTAARSIRNLLLIRAEAGRAALRGDPAQAAWIWRYRPVAPAHVTPVDMYRDLVDALLARGQLDQADAVINRLRARFPQSGAFRKLHARLAIDNGNWPDALLRWQEVAQAQPDGAAPLPAEWVYRIGVARARAQTDALAPGPTRALGYLSLAAALRAGDEVLALTLARGAKAYYREQVLELLVRILSANTRYTAAIWWARHLIETAETPRRHMAQLFEALIASSRLDDCEQALAGYLDAYGRDTLWLRVRVECSYRRSDFGAMQAVMQEAMETGVARYHGSVRVMDWLYKLIRLDPEPRMFLPPEIRDLAMSLASRYDTASIAGALRDLLAPDRAERIAQRHAAQIRDARDNTLLIEAVEQEKMVNLALRRRDWPQLEALGTLPLPDCPDTASAKSLWNVARHRIDIELARADLAAAEVTACALLDQLAAQGHDSHAISFAQGLVFRLPLSGSMLDRLAACARRLDFAQMVQRLERWQARYAGIDPVAATGRAGRNRCFILGNAPSLADMPLQALAGEDVFCVNRGMRAMEHGLPQPRFLVVADPHVYRNHAREIDADGASVEQCFIGANCLWRQQPEMAAIPFGSSGLKLSLRPLQPAPLHLHRGETVVVLAAQIAAQMGYREIHILGVDLDYSGPATHFYGGGRKETDRLSNFRPGGSATALVNLAFANLQKVVASQGCRISNAAPGGRLTSLERVDFDSLFDRSEPRFRAN